MVWRARFSRRAVAETQLQKAIKKAGLGYGYTTNRDIDFTIEEQKKVGLRGTNVDGAWFGLNVVCFYDGPHHLKDRQQSKDERVDAVLRERGYTVLRFPYHPPLTKQREREIIKTCRSSLKRKGYPAHAKLEKLI